MPELPPHTGPGPVGTGAERRPRYRSLRDLSHGPRRAPGNRPPGTPDPSPGQPAPAGAVATRAAVTPGMPDSRGAAHRVADSSQRRSPLRHTVVGAVVMLLLVGLAWGGYTGYRYFAPYYGLGYVTGGTGTVDDVTFTVTSAECGLNAAPAKSAKPVKGQFCVLEVDADSHSDKTRYLSLSMFSVQLDTGSRANPTGTAMRALSTKLAPGESRELQLVYDVWDGVRMDSLKVQIGYETANIALI